ncbi:unnamed protein product [Schistocephalus solidus]|uniref:Uncharacterized protein n=1 Tax=Schistocephalus solidus TaxID=70667 RepID=A0A183TLH9_SCHSO|nr:unnamed protein product [Schistocephalus solidus]
MVLVDQLGRTVLPVQIRPFTVTPEDVPRCPLLIPSPPAPQDCVCWGIENCAAASQNDEGEDNNNNKDDDDDAALATVQLDSAGAEKVNEERQRDAGDDDDDDDDADDDDPHPTSTTSINSRVSATTSFPEPRLRLRKEHARLQRLRIDAAFSSQYVANCCIGVRGHKMGNSRDLICFSGQKVG